MKNILIINQSAELYGADKALLELLENFPENYTPIVVLHETGPLTVRLEQLGIKVINSSVIKVKRGILGPLFFLMLPFEVIKSITTINRELKGTKIDFVYSNAISVFIGAFYSFLLGKKHIWHVHEIIEHPHLLAKMYPKVVSFFSDKIIFNSQASFNQFKRYKNSIEKKSVVVHNGQNRTFPFISNEEKIHLREDVFGADHSKIFIGLIGRISRLKGQQLLLNAFKKLTHSYNNIHLVYVGSAPDGQEHYLENLKQKVISKNLDHQVTILDFQENIWPYYDALDIIVVPSTEPESFGLVATEAMLSKKPVIGSNLGGLVEIIVDDKTGYLFEPKNAHDLEEKIKILLDNPEKIIEFGQNGHQRVLSNFSTKKYVEGIKKEFDTIT